MEIYSDTLTQILEDSDIEEKVSIKESDYTDSNEEFEILLLQQNVVIQKNVILTNFFNKNANILNNMIDFIVQPF